MDLATIILEQSFLVQILYTENTVYFMDKIILIYILHLILYTQKIFCYRIVLKFYFKIVLIEN